ncbi:MAG: short-chain dehydrogenase/reductase [Microbacteriaceae bacterium]|nr:short-chain dehydrogenase/reductase [Microbacteriaceae bacterium]
MSAIDCVGRTVLITGAGSGLGRSMAIALAEAGAEIVAAVRRPETGVEVVDEIVAAGGKAIWVECDVREQDQIKNAVAKTVEHFGKLDVMISNATSPASALQGELDVLDDGVWEQLAATNLRASFWFAKAAFPHLKAAGGTLILLTSGRGIEAAGIQPEYGATKAGVRAFAKSLAAEWGPQGVTVNCLSPAGITPAYEAVFEQLPEWAATIRETVPLGRVGDPMKDIAPVMVFLASTAAQFITGQTITATGGRTMLL